MTVKICMNRDILKRLLSTFFPIVRNMSTAKQIYTITDLTEAQKSIIRALVPVLELSGELLTKTFYQSMLANYPIVRPFFNESDQKLLRQPKILAFALLNYAKNIDDLTPLLGFVRQIVEKHVGLQVEAEHYPIVGESLLKTMVQLLGEETANAEFLAAWSTAYGNLAQILINMEHEKNQLLPWTGFRRFTVTKLVDECQDVKSVYFKPSSPEDKIGVPKRGQYVCIRWLLPGETEEKSREYSLSQFPSENEYRISVRRVPGGKISGYVHQQLKVGDELKVAQPAGLFVYEESKKDVVLVVGGIGITPIVSILEQSLQKGRTVTLLNSNKTVKSRPFGTFLRQLKEKYPNALTVKEYFSEEQIISDSIDAYKLRRLTKEDLGFINNEKDVYLLGPRGFMSFVKAELADKNDNVKLEFFGPTEV